MAANDILTANGIHLRSHATGDHKATCPRCSQDRRKRSDPCLSVKVEADGGATWLCHHCGWAGGDRPNERRPRREYKRPSPVVSPERPDSLMAWFARRGISSATAGAAGVYRTRHYFSQL